MTSPAPWTTGEDVWWLENLPRLLSHSIEVPTHSVLDRAMLGKGFQNGLLSAFAPSLLPRSDPHSPST